MAFFEREQYISVERELGHIPCLIEFGPHSTQAVEEFIIRLSERDLAPHAKTDQAAKFLLGTPFYPESALPIPRRGVLRLRLETLDCVTLVYTVIALARSKSLIDFAQNLACLRYRDENSLDSNPDQGTILDFCSESLIVQGVHLGYLRDVTCECVHWSLVRSYSAFERPIQRPEQFDPEKRVVRRKIGSEMIASTFIPTEHLDQVESDNVKSGDILLFTRSKDDQCGNLVSHCAIAVVMDDILTFIHASRNASCRRDVPVNFAGRHTGLFYQGDARIEQLGVSLSYWPTEPDVVAMAEGQNLYGYDDTRIRSLTDYCRNCGFTGVKIMRPC
ncbi:DUF1460 domain-containing protein [Ensifer sp. IC4062]|nr:DUF1460 domain-containing protein [Ensifer sp. IC4062]